MFSNRFIFLGVLYLVGGKKMTGYSDCTTCGSTTAEERRIAGRCPACYSVEEGIGSTTEIPTKALEKLVSAATTRHPTAVDDAHVFKNVLVENGVLDED